MKSLNLLNYFNLLSSREELEAVDEIDHEIAGKAVVFGFGDVIGCFGTGNVALLLQDVVYFEANGCLFVFQE
ncbi:MAG: hypothetical protein LUE98_05150 [Tannerellaceae bacterium]|nr:hypothetical protein [Tannerellaceae bacterium]